MKFNLWGTTCMHRMRLIIGRVCPSRNYKHYAAPIVIFLSHSRHEIAFRCTARNSLTRSVCSVCECVWVREKECVLLQERERERDLVYKTEWEIKVCVCVCVSLWVCVCVWERYSVCVCVCHGIRHSLTVLRNHFFLNFAKHMSKRYLSKLSLIYTDEQIYTNL